jgi:tetratricopeptide (TPR) repeat protein
MRNTKRGVVSALVAVAIGLGAAAAVAHEGLDEELEGIEALMQVDPGNVGLAIERADLLLDLERPEEALDVLRRVADGDEHTASELTRRFAEAFAEDGRDAEALQQLAWLVERGDDTARTHALRGIVYARVGDAEAAAGALAQSMAAGPNVEVALQWAALLDELGRTEEAAAALRSGIEALEGAVVLREALAEVEARRGELDAACAELAAIIDAAPVAVPWRLRRAELLAAAGRGDEALSERELALADATRMVERRRSAAAYAWRAAAFRALGDEQAAALDDAEAARRRPAIAQDGGAR